MIYPTPTLLLDEQRCRANIALMAAKASSHGLIFRPHFKTHQSLALGRWFKEAGVTRITVSSLTMAEYFASDWDDITVAFPVNTLEIETINRLAARITLNLLVESAEAVRFLVENLRHAVGFFIKIDVGAQRTGIAATDSAATDAIVKIAAQSAKLRFLGFLAHAGHTYGATSPQEVLAIHHQTGEFLSRLKDRYRQDYPQCLVSVGDTPGCSLATDFTGIGEIRPGNFVFYDLMQHRLGACDAEQIAVALSCPVVAVHPRRGEVVLYGGAIHFSKERLTDPDFGPIYGQVARRTANGWGELVPGMIVKSLSQEHGVVVVPEREISSIKVGQCLLVIPVHSCLTVNLMRCYTGLESGEIFTTM
jgi:D-serine deaminase-like pyridoxal phosphate-dependent protein